jgi:hypothetical protein
MLVICEAAEGEGLHINVISFVNSVACVGVIRRVELIHGGKEMDLKVGVEVGGDAELVVWA